MAEEYSIVLRIDGKLVREWHKPVTAPSSVKTQKVSLMETPDPSSLNTGWHTLELIIDPYQSVAETNEENNSFVVVRQIPFGLPDLEPHSPEDLPWEAPVVFGGADVVYGSELAPADVGYYLAFGLTNSGEQAAASWGRGSQITVDGLIIPDSFADAKNDSEPRPGEVLISAVPIWKITIFERSLLPGDHQINWMIDKADSVLELDEANNVLSLSVNLPRTRARSTADQPDESGPKIHLIYVLPADGVDEQWDINGTIDSIVGSMQEWLVERTDGRSLRLDTIDGSLDITFLRLVKTKGDIVSAALPAKLIVDDLHAAGFNDPDKIYAVWYPYPVMVEGPESICGLQTTTNGVKFALSFFERTASPDLNRCVRQDTTMLHEIFHALGAVSGCARSSLTQSKRVYAGHVDDDPNDLMYAGNDLGAMIELDKDNDDYYGHGVSWCSDVATSLYLTPPPQ